MPAVELVHDAYGDARAHPVILLHGFPLSRAIWSESAPRLAKDLRVVAPDLRGFGASPRPDEPASMETYADDVLALADRLRLERFDLVGHSMGGYVSLALLAKAPGRVRRLVLATTKATADSPEAKENRRRHVGIVQQHGVGELAAVLVPAMVAPSTPKLVVEEARRAAESNPASGVVRALEAMAERPDRTPLLAKVAAPTLVLAGAEDRLMPRAEQERMAAAIPGARFEALERCGHLPMMERPDAFAEAVARHLVA